MVKGPCQNVQPERLEREPNRRTPRPERFICAPNARDIDIDSLGESKAQASAPRRPMLTDRVRREAPSHPHVAPQPRFPTGGNVPDVAKNRRVPRQIRVERQGVPLRRLTTR